jgi:iron complex outermembrane receptor protein
MFKKRKLAALLPLACSPIALMGAIAQEAPATDAVEAEVETQQSERRMGEVVVTAQRREQSLRDVPISLTAFSNEDILQNDITELNDYAILTPNVGFNDGRVQGEASLTIRGIGQLGGEQDTFGTYLDGFELPSTAGRIYDLERIEVLRGPQGTTFGRNVIAGLINLTSATPDPESRDGYVTGDFGSFGLVDLEGAVSLPMGEKSALRVAGFYQSQDGWLENESTGPESNDVETWGGRLTFASEPTPQLKLKTLVSHEVYGQGLGNDAITDGIVIGTVPTLQAIIDTGLGMVPPGTIPAGPDTYFPNQNDTVRTDSPAFNDFELTQAIARFDYDLGPASLVGIGGFTRFNREGAGDGDMSEFNITFFEFDNEVEYYSAELRLESNGDERLDWDLGIYATNEQAQGRPAEFFSGTDAEAFTFLPAIITGAPIDLTILPNNSRLTGGVTEEESDSFAAYGELNYELTERLTILGGARYTKNELSESITDGADLVDVGGGLLGLASIPDAEDSVDTDKVTWRTSLLFEATDDINLYGSVSTGFRAGGLQLNNTVSSDFGPEDIINYEVGGKAFFFDRRVSLNLAYFLMQWDDIQITTLNRTNNQLFTDNASKAEASGFELEFMVAPTDSLTFSGGLGYVETELTEFDDPTDGRLGSPLPNAPEWKASFVADYRKPVFNDTDGFIRVLYIYNDEQLTGLIDEGVDAPRFLDSYDRIDVRVGLERVNDFSIEAYVENAADDIYATGSDVSGFSIAGAPTVSPPQRFGIRLRKEF